MSTDFGYKCRECDEYLIVDNMREPRFLLESLDQVVYICAAIALLKRFDVDDITSWRGDVLGGWDFAHKHRAQGHTVVVIDEYRREWDRCRELWRCGACKHTEWCGLKVGHAGEHQSERRTS